MLVRAEQASPCVPDADGCGPFRWRLGRRLCAAAHPHPAAEDPRALPRCARWSPCDAMSARRLRLIETSPAARTGARCASRLHLGGHLQHRRAGRAARGAARGLAGGAGSASRRAARRDAGGAAASRGCDRARLRPGPPCGGRGRPGAGAAGRHGAVQRDCGHGDGMGSGARATAGTGAAGAHGAAHRVLPRDPLAAEGRRRSRTRCCAIRAEDRGGGRPCPIRAARAGCACRSMPMVASQRRREPLMPAAEFFGRWHALLRALRTPGANLRFCLASLPEARLRP